MIPRSSPASAGEDRNPEVTAVSPEQETQQPHRPRTKVEKARLGTRIGLGALLASAVIWFMVANSQEVEVDWFVVETHSRLFLVILLSAVLGALVDRLIRWRRGRKPGK
jgi:uncharacterized integral membrane protein